VLLAARVETGGGHVPDCAKTRPWLGQETFLHCLCGGRMRTCICMYVCEKGEKEGEREREREREGEREREREREREKERERE